MMENLVSTRLLSIILAECSEQMLFQMDISCYMDRVKFAMCMLDPNFTPHFNIQSVNSNYTANYKFKYGTVIELDPSVNFRFDYQRRDMEFKILEVLKEFLKYYNLTFKERTKKEIEKFEEDDMD